MKTELNKCFELLLEKLVYDGNSLIAELNEQFLDDRRNIKTSSKSRQFQVIFDSVVSHLLIEEFTESVADLVKNYEKDFLREIKNKQLTHFLGLDVPEKYGNLNCYALFTSHEILIVYCDNSPEINLK